MEVVSPEFWFARYLNWPVLEKPRVPGSLGQSSTVEGAATSSIQTLCVHTCFLAWLILPVRSPRQLINRFFLFQEIVVSRHFPLPHVSLQSLCSHIKDQLSIIAAIRVQHYCIMLSLAALEGQLLLVQMLVMTSNISISSLELVSHRLHLYWTENLWIPQWLVS